MNMIITLNYSKKILSKSEKSACFKWTHGLSGNVDRVATLPKSVIGIIM